MSFLEVKNIKKNFGNTEVLKDISFDMDKGQVVSVIGSSGSGKTTLLRCLNFLETPDSGSIRIKDELLFDSSVNTALSEKEIRKKRLHFGLVFQSFNLFPQYTAIDNICLAPSLLSKEDPSIDASAIRDRAYELLIQMGLSNRVDNYPHELSGGQQQRVAIARALALNPDILCFDEPTSALNPELTGEVLKVIRELADKKTTMIIVTHEMSFARDVSDIAIFMDKGVIVEQGPSKEIIDSPRLERTKQFLAYYR
ncbi:MAG: amino acid ABC transporter ATP-binding protein [Lachnospiraceae bacterium]|nr:amino acid ABC transporter ATP-binding protein [Lachnospiraceae bacterium]